MVSVLNPKSIGFFAAFGPQFRDPAAPLAAQVAVLVVPFTAIGGVNVACRALLAGRLSGAVRRPALRRALNRGGGATLVAAGAATPALWRA